MSGSTRSDKPREPRNNGPLDPGKLSQETEDALCALVETRLARNKRDAQLVLKLHQLLSLGNYKVMIMIGKYGVTTSSLAILETGAGSNLIKEDFVLAVWAPTIENV